MDLKIRVMKIKGLLFGLFACAALAACTNDDIVENNGKGEQEKVKGNLTLVIAASNNSSRAAEDGDETDGGTTAESKVNSVLVVLAPVNSEGAFNGDQIVESVAGTELQETTIGGNVAYVAPTFQLNANGEYKVLVVANPNQGIIDAVTNANPTEKYAAVENYAYSYAGTGTNEMVGTDEVPSFMMVNQTESTVNVESNNKDNPTTVTVNVERIASKITFVPATMTAGDNTYSNRYAVKVVTGQKEVAETREGYRMEGGVGYHMTGLNKAKLLSDNSIIWIQNGSRAFTQTENKYPGTDLYIYESITMPTQGEFDYIWNTSSNTEKNWYVQLDDYALVNLSKDVYAVRHLAKADFSATKTFGLLDATYRWVLDPNTTAKNSENTSNIAGDYFYNKVADVQAAEKDYAADQTPESYANYFSVLPTTAAEGQGGKIGTRLAYCLENVVKVDNQQPAMVTGIIFRAQIYNENHQAMGTIYKCGGSYYTTLEQMYSEHPGTTDFETYNSGKCYYYSSDIMHSSDDDHMKKVIMRNNVYVLSVKSFTDMGSAEVTIPTGGEDHDKNFYLKLTSTILPWQVRFNNIKF